MGKPASHPSAPIALGATIVQAWSGEFPAKWLRAVERHRRAGFATRVTDLYPDRYAVAMIEIGNLRQTVDVTVEVDSQAAGR